MLAEKSIHASPYWPGPGAGAAAPGRRLSSQSIRRTEMKAALRWLDTREQGKVVAVTRRTRSALARRVDRLNAPVVYPWSPSISGARPAHQLHRLAAVLLRRRSNGALSRLWLAVKAVAWPALAFAAAVLIVGRCGRHVRDRHGFSRLEQWRDVIEAALKHGIFPSEYYYRRVFATTARGDKALYLNEREMIALLSAADRGVDCGQVDDLQRLYATCRQGGIPIPRTVAEFSGIAVKIGGAAGKILLPEKDLYLRPVRWTAEAGGQYWRWSPKTRTWQHNRLTLTAPALLRRLGRESAGRSCLLQEAIRNHPEVARFSPGPLCSYRVATGMGESGRPEVLFAAFHFPGTDLAGEAAVAVDLESGVDLASGRLLPAVGEFVADGEFDNHPATGMIITGAAAPHWHAVREVALKAHALFADIPFVGWEIGVGGSGPVLLDASTNWGFFSHVLPAATRFAELCLRRVAQGGEDCGPASS